MIQSVRLRVLLELASLTAELLDIEYQKKEANANFNIQIKALKKSIGKLAYEIKNERK